MAGETHSRFTKLHDFAHIDWTKMWFRDDEILQEDLWGGPSLQFLSALISESLASFAVFSHPQVLLYGLAEERNGRWTPALLAASTGSLPAEASGGRAWTVLLRAKGAIGAQLGITRVELSWDTFVGYFLQHWYFANLI